MTDDYTTNSHYLTNTYLFEKVERTDFLYLGMIGLKLTGHWHCLWCNISTIITIIHEILSFQLSTAQSSPLRRSATWFLHRARHSSSVVKCPVPCTATRGLNDRERRPRPDRSVSRTDCGPVSALTVKVCNRRLFVFSFNSWMCP